MITRLSGFRAAGGRSPRMPPVRLTRAAESVRSGRRKAGLKLVPPPASVLDLTMGFATAQAIFTAARLGIADVLADGPLTASAIARQLNTDPDATYRLLRALAMQSVFSERADGRFEMSSLAEPLRTDSPPSIRPLLLMLGHRLYWEQWGQLAESVRSGRTSIETAYGMPLFAVLEQDAEMTQIFNDAMAAIEAGIRPGQP